jgi:methyl-accepting chemotaxis protein
VSAFRNISLKGKLIVLAGVLLGLLIVQAVLELGGATSHGVTFVTLAVGLAVGGGLTYATVHHLSRSLKDVLTRLDSVAEATEGNLVPALKAMSDGDLTVELHSATKPITEFDGDELGQVMRHVENFRDAVLNCYEAYNATGARLREVMGTVSNTAGAVSTASEQMSATSEEAGKATNEVAHAIGDVAAGAERQARMAEDAQRSAQDIARAVDESAENAERTAEVAQGAHEAAQQGVGAAEEANQAMLERELARHTAEPDEQLIHERRSDKAAYLREKREEQRRSPDR